MDACVLLLVTSTAYKFVFSSRFCWAVQPCHYWNNLYYFCYCVHSLCDPDSIHVVWYVIAIVRTIVVVFKWQRMDSSGERIIKPSPMSNAPVSSVQSPLVQCFCARACVLNADIVIDHHSITSCLFAVVNCVVKCLFSTDEKTKLQTSEAGCSHWQAEMCDYITCSSKLI